jgi:hypothetical protein
MAKNKDERYKIVQNMLLQKNLTVFSQIFLYIPRKVVCTDMGMNYARFISLIRHPADFRFKELIAMAVLFDIDAKELIDLAWEQILQRKKKP